MKDIEEFISAVDEMRKLQIRFFKGERSVVERAKAAEKKVDEILKEYRSGQTKLF